MNGEILKGGKADEEINRMDIAGGIRKHHQSEELKRTMVNEKKTNSVVSSASVAEGHEGPGESMKENEIKKKARIISMKERTELISTEDLA